MTPGMIREAHRLPDDDQPDCPARPAARLARVVELALVDVGLTLPQYRLLAHLSRGSSWPSPVAKQLGTSLPSVTALVDGVVAKGLVERRTDDEDRRRVFLTMTEQGRRSLEAADGGRQPAPRGARRAPRRGRRRPGVRGPGPLVGSHRTRSRTGSDHTTMSVLDAGPRSGEHPPDPIGSFDLHDQSLPFEPVTARLRYPPPQATIDPDTSKGWIARMWPVLRSHTALFVVALLAGMVSMIVRVLVPRVVGTAVDQALLPAEGSRDPLGGYVAVLGVLAVVGMVTGYLMRYLLFRTAYAIENDLRVLMYRHLTRMSFPFYDRVQSGQLISRANSDIRSVQMFLAFGPFFIAQFAMFAVAVTFMAQINVGLTLLAVATLPLVYVVGVRMRRSMFPMSWVMQARMADIATLVDENINGVRVVKSFAAEERQIGVLAAAVAAAAVDRPSS